MNSIRFLLAAVVLGTVSAAFAQNAGTSDRRPAGPGFAHGRGGHGPRGMSPIIRVIDTNKDQTLSADEIANAAASLATLDKTGDGKINADDVRAAIADHPRMQGKRPQRADAPGRFARERIQHANPVMLALDADANRKLSPAEIANAAMSLSALDANKDGQLTPDELRPLPPQE